MSIWRMLLAELAYRKLGAAMSLAAVAAAAALLVAGPTLVEAYRLDAEKELAGLEQRVEASASRLAEAERLSNAEMLQLEDDTRKVMRDLGFNLLLVHRDTDIVQFLASRLPTIDMPQSYLDQLARDRRLTLVTHLVGALRGRTEFDGRQVTLTGYVPEIPQSHMPHETPMGYAVERGTALLGRHLAGQRKPGDSIEIGGRTFRVAAVLPEQGTDDDSAIALHLSDAQQLWNKPGQLNLILALECRCSEDSLPTIRRQIAAVLPQTQILRDTAKAVARAKQRAMVRQQNQQLIARHQSALEERAQALADTRARRAAVQERLERLWGLITPLVVLAAGVWVGLLALGNVRQRRQEIGLLRALGKGSGAIATLLLGKALLVGLAGALLGTVVGALAARALAQSAFDLPGGEIPWLVPLWLYALLGAPLLSVLASYLPTLTALAQDPAVVLRDG